MLVDQIQPPDRSQDDARTSGHDEPPVFQQELPVADGAHVQAEEARTAADDDLLPPARAAAAKPLGTIAAAGVERGDIPQQRTVGETDDGSRDDSQNDGAENGRKTPPDATSTNETGATDDSETAADGDGPAADATQPPHGGDGDNGDRPHGGEEDNSEDPDYERMRRIVGATVGGRDTVVELHPDAPDGVIAKGHVLLATTELTPAQINAQYQVGMNAKGINVPPEAAEAWRTLELALCQQTDQSQSLEARREQVDRALTDMGAVAANMLAVNEVTEEDQENVEDPERKPSLLLDSHDEYRYLALAGAYGPAFYAQLEGRHVLNNAEREEIYANVGDLLWKANSEIDDLRLDRIEDANEHIIGSYAELVTIGASLHPSSAPLFPTPQRGFRTADVQQPYKDPQGRPVERQLDIKFGDTTGTRYGATNRIRVARLANAAVYPQVVRRDPSWGKAAWSAVQTIGQLVAADSRGLPIQPDGQKMLELFAWAIPKRVEVINRRTGIADFLHEA